MAVSIHRSHIHNWPLWKFLLLSMLWYFFSCHCHPVREIKNNNWWLKAQTQTHIFFIRCGYVVSAVYGVISWGTTIRFMTCRAALQRFRDFTKLSCAAGPRFRKPFLSWRESRALPLKFVQSRYGLGQHCMCNNAVAHLWFWPSFVTVFVVLMLCVKAHSL